MRREYERLKKEIERMLRITDTTGVVRMDRKRFEMPQGAGKNKDDRLPVSSLSSLRGGSMKDEMESLPDKMRRLKADLSKLVFLVIRELINDMAIYNKFPELKTNKKGIKLSGGVYNEDYYKSLLEDMKGDFVIGLCYLHSISYVDFVNHCLSNKMIYSDGVDIDSKNNPIRRRGDRTIKRLVKSLKDRKK